MLVIYLWLLNLNMHGDRLAPHAWGPSCPTCMGTVLSHMHGDRLARHAWGPSCPTCMETVLPHIHGDRLAPHAWGPSCPTCMETVLPHRHNLCLNTMFTKHNTLLLILYCFTCQLINNIIMSPIKPMIHTVIKLVSPLYYWQNISSVHIMMHIKDFACVMGAPYLQGPCCLGLPYRSSIVYTLRLAV